VAFCRVGGAGRTLGLSNVSLALFIYPHGFFFLSLPTKRKGQIHHEDDHLCPFDTTWNMLFHLVWLQKNDPNSPREGRAFSYFETNTSVLCPFLFWFTIPISLVSAHLHRGWERARASTHDSLTDPFLVNRQSAGVVSV